MNYETAVPWGMAVFIRFLKKGFTNRGKCAIIGNAKQTEYYTRTGGIFAPFFAILNVSVTLLKCKVPPCVVYSFIGVRCSSLFGDNRNLRFSALASVGALLF